MRDVKFCWFAPTSGDFEYVCSATPSEEASISSIINIAKDAEAMGFDDILIPIDPRCMDSIITASFILQNTSKINTVIAYRPGITTPQVLGTMLKTLDNNTNRVKLNLVQGTVNDALAQGYPADSLAFLQNRMYSFAKSFTELLHANGFHNYEDEHYIYKNASINPIHQSFELPLFVSGGEFAMRLAGEFFDYYMTFGDSIDNIKAYIEAAKSYARVHHQRTIKVGMGVNIVARATTEEALNDCHKMILHASDESLQQTRAYYRQHLALGNRKFEDLASNDFMIDRNVWAGLAQVRTGPVATIYGSYEEVANKIADYIDIGVEYFSLTGYPYRKEVENVGKVIHLLKKELANV
ncbi:LLM class flavin-dependent oxidoreductase [Lysinibacillus sp. NPDC098008]|uniref:LLM class flavin-dependent oxidoreductase n=1 Tax=Lysinibacillus sp. NPDC098008 TaxID=3364146 RepID=UPI00381D22AB